MPKPRLVRRIFKCLAALAVLGFLGAGVLLGSLWLEKRSEVTLPIPTGPFAVGRSIQVWADETQPDLRASVPGARRELLVWIWYPAVAGSAGAVADEYSPAWMREASARARVAAELARPAPMIVRVLTPIFRLLTRDESRVHGHSLRDPGLSPSERPFPVVVMRGGASTSVINYTTLAEDLASHGYFVVGLDAPYRTGSVVFPDGRVIGRMPENDPDLYSGAEFQSVGNRLLAAWTADIAFVLDRVEHLNASDASGRFTGRLDLARVGVFGHSFGGAQAAQFCSEDPRCKAGIDIDGAPLGRVIQAGIHRPFMFLLSDHGRESDPESQKIKADIRSIYDHLPPDGRSLVEIRGAFHFTFSDDGALLKSRVVRGALRVLGKLGIDGRRQLTVTSYCVRSFFDAYLKGTGVSPLNLSSPQYPEIRVIE